MEIIYIVWFFIIGCCFGSFFGVVGGRVPEGESIVKPGSYCYYCKHELKWYELIPIISYVIQKGKCRNCKKDISVFYPLVEVVTGILFSISYISFGFTYQLIFALLISSILSIVLVSDIIYMIIPDSIIIVFSLLFGIVTFLFKGISSGFLSLLNGSIMFLIMYLIMLCGNHLFKKESLGGADIKLMFIVGLVLGPLLGLLNIFIASCIALPVSIISLIQDKDNVIPFGPFLLLSLFLIYIFNIDYSLIQLF